MLKVVQLNVLAPLWVGEVYKQFPCYREIVSPARLDKMCEFLRGLEADVYILCEVDADVLEVLQSHFARTYSITFTSNKRGFWSEHLAGKEWIENGTCVMCSKVSLKVLKRSYIDLGDGCMATSVSTREFTFVSVHFDTGNRKYLEADVLLQALSKLPCATTCIVSGDFNMISTREFEEHGYIASGGLCQAHTTILQEGVIDHTLVRGARQILSRVLYGLVPSSSGSVTYNIAQRMCKSPSGSDHYATLSKILL